MQTTAMGSTLGQCSESDWALPSPTTPENTAGACCAAGSRTRADLTLRKSERLCTKPHDADPRRGLGRSMSEPPVRSGYQRPNPTDYI
jgi:hypothetical protein